MDPISTPRPGRRTRPRPAPRRFAALVAVLVAAGSSLPAQADTIVRQVSGKVEIGRGEPPVWNPLAVGEAVAPNDRIRTGGDGRVELAVDAGTLRVHENSLLSIPPADAHADRVELENGHSLFDVLRREGRRFEVRTPSVVVSVKGTRFGVEADSESGVVSVYRGVVGVHLSEATDGVETLVREGFLATGGVDLPVELDVLPAGDPWTDWQDPGKGADQRSSSKTRESEVDRARRSVRRATDGEVVKRAVERKPEIAERLRQQAGDTKIDARTTDDTATSFPASPEIRDVTEPLGDVLDATIDGVDTLLDPNDTQREILDSTRGVEELVDQIESVDVEGITQGATFPNGLTTPLITDLTDLAVSEVVMLTEAMESMQAASVDSGQTWTTTDVTSYLENDLISQGLNTEDATRLVQQLFGN